MAAPKKAPRIKRHSCSALNRASRLLFKQETSGLHEVALQRRYGIVAPPRQHQIFQGIVLDRYRPRLPGLPARLETVTNIEVVELLAVGQQNARAAPGDQRHVEGFMRRFPVPVYLVVFLLARTLPAELGTATCRERCCSSWKCCGAP